MMAHCMPVSHHQGTPYGLHVIFFTWHLPDPYACCALTLSTPHLTPLPRQLVAHTSLTHLGLPCSLGDAELALLSKLPRLVCLRTCRPLTLPLPGVPCRPLTGVTQLVTSGMEFRGVGAGVVFPALQQLVVRRLGPEEAAAMKGCMLLREVTGQDASLLPDRGLAVLGQLPQLEALEVHDAVQVWDKGGGSPVRHGSRCMHTACNTSTPNCLQRLM